MPGTILLDDLHDRANEFSDWVGQLNAPPPPPPPAPPASEPQPAVNPVQPALDTLGQAKDSFLNWADQLHAQDQPAVTTAPTSSDSLTNPLGAPAAAAPTPAVAEPPSDFLQWVDQGAKPVNDWLTQRSQDVGTAVQAVQAAGPSLPHAEEPATATDRLGDKWKTQFDFHQTYTGDYRTGTPHRGIDVVPQQGGIGTPVEAFVPGEVSLIQRDSGGAGGLMVYVKDRDGLTHAYMHLQDTAPGLKVGQQVNRGDYIAKMGESGTEGSPHLHYEVRKGLNGDPLDQLIDPRPYMAGAGTASQPLSTGAARTPAAATGAMPNVQVDASSPEAFIRSVTPAAQWVADKTGIPAAAMIGMAANETGYGKFAAGNNLFGIKGTGPAGSTNAGTWEDYGNGPVQIRDNFRAYESAAQSFQDFADLIQNAPRYAKALGQSTVEGFVGALKQGGYMTDPDYVGKIQSIVNRWQPVIAQAGTGVADTLSRATQTGQDLVRQTQDTLAATQQTGARPTTTSTDQQMASFPGSNRSLLEDTRSSGFRAPDEILNPGGIVSTAQQWLQDRGEELRPGGATANAIGEFTAPRFPGVGEAIGGALDSLSGPGAASDEEILRRAKPYEIANARGTVQGFNDAYTDKRGLPREEVSDADVAAFLRGTQTARVAAMSGAGAAPQAVAGAARALSAADRAQGFMSSNMLLNPSSQVMNAVTQTEQTARAPIIRAMAGYGDEALEGLKMLGAASSDALKGFGQMVRSGTSRSNPGARAPIGLEAPGLRFTAAQDEAFRAWGGQMERGMELQRLVKENPGVPKAQLVQQFDKELQEAAAKGGASAVFGEGGISGGLGSKIAQLKSELINNADPNIGSRLAKQGLGWMLYGVVPFSQMPETLLKTGIRRVPGISEAIGGAQTIGRVAAGDSRGARLKGAETVFDGLINSAIVYHVVQGNITGPDDPEHPSKVRIGDKWFDYTSLGPLGLRMGVAAAMADALKREDNKLDPDKLGAVINSFGKVASNEWFFKGAADAVSQFGQGGTERVLGKQVQAFGDRLMPAASLLDYINKSTDPLERDPAKELPNAIWERPMSKFPRLSGLVPPKIDPTTGEPERRVEQGPGAQLIGIETEQSDPGQAELARLKRGGFSLNEPDQSTTKFTINSSEIKMTEAEQQLYQEARGHALAGFAANGMQEKDYQQADDKAKARRWQGVMSAASNAARATVLASMTPEQRAKRLREGYRVVGKLSPIPEPTPEPSFR